ncbi:hypothetical protein ACVNS2_25485 [Paenibacillus caseinilyticus]|uniref:Transcriptional regulator n=1 Tax=Paenibacillus mucilaginosus K02 TaxID=997761 RepID=I0BNT2_9BACL|nr:hypothetical protein [Paenibacillus mucilaginosus]AFH64029.1 hypothetical protein B2K_25645 [Paenibacillus mucilaginosus K02]
MTDAQQKILDALKRDRFVSAYGLSLMTSLPVSQVMEELPLLVSTNQVKYLPLKNAQGKEEKAYYLASR